MRVNTRVVLYIILITTHITVCESSLSQLKSEYQMKEYFIISNCIVHIVVAKTAIEALKKGFEWFNSKQVKVMLAPNVS